MPRPAAVESTKLNLGEVTILAGGGSPTEVDVLMQILSGFGARQLRRAEHAPQVRDMLDRTLIDLLILDSMMGLEASMEIVRAMRRMTTPNRTTPVVLTAGNALPSLIREARQNGVNYVVAKPLTPRVLFERLVWVVKDPRLFIQAETYVGPDRRVRAMGPPAGMAGRRADDLPAEVGAATTANLSQDDIDAMMFPTRKAR